MADKHQAPQGGAAAVGVGGAAVAEEAGVRGALLDPVKPLVDAMLREDLGAPKKQRHTVRRVLARLVDEHAVTGISYSTVRD